MTIRLKPEPDYIRFSNDFFFNNFSYGEVKNDMKERNIYRNFGGSDLKLDSIEQNTICGEENHSSLNSI